jgi:hypothetical protein
VHDRRKLNKAKSKTVTVTDTWEEEEEEEEDHLVHDFKDHGMTTQFIIFIANSRSANSHPSFSFSSSSSCSSLLFSVVRALNPSNLSNWVVFSHHDHQQQQQSFEYLKPL